MADRKWFKVYVQWSDSEWLINLEPGPRLCWPLLIEWVKCMGTGGIADMGRHGKIAHHFSVPQEWIDTLIEAGINKGAISIEGNRIIVQKWAEYQGDPTVTERVRRSRAQKAKPDGNGGNALQVLRNGGNAYVTGVTPVTTEKEKEKEKEKEREKESVQTRESSGLNPPPVLPPNGSLLKTLNAPPIGPDEEANRQRELIRSQAAAARSIN